jgi:transposase-like protein
VVPDLKEEVIVARKNRSFGIDFKRQVVLEFLSGEYSAAVLCRRYEISQTLLQHWKKAYEAGRLEDSGESNEVEVLKARIRSLEALVAQVSLENQLLKKTAARAVQQRNESPSIVTGAPSPSAKRVR